MNMMMMVLLCSVQFKAIITVLRILLQSALYSHVMWSMVACCVDSSDTSSDSDSDSDPEKDNKFASALFMMVGDEFVDRCHL